MSVVTVINSYFPSISNFFRSLKGKDDKKYLNNENVQEVVLWIRENIHDQQMAEAMYLDLINENPFNIAYLENKELTQKLCSHAFAINQSVKDLIPANFFTTEMHHTLYINDPNYFKYLPDSMKTAALCLIAVTDNSDNLKYVPADLRTPAILKAAFNNVKSKNFV